MSKIAQLQFAAMSPDAQRAAVRRLALTGLDDLEVAERTGWAPELVRAVLAPPHPVDSIPLALLKNRRSGSPGGAVGEP